MKFGVNSTFTRVLPNRLLCMSHIWNTLSASLMKELKHVILWTISSYKLHIHFVLEHIRLLLNYYGLRSFKDLSLSSMNHWQSPWWRLHSRKKMHLESLVSYCAKHNLVFMVKDRERNVVEEEKELEEVHWPLLCLLFLIFPSFQH